MWLWLVFILLEVARNYHLINKEKERPNYFLSFVLRGMAWVGVGIYLDVTPDNWPLWMLIATTSFWLIFDLVLNLVRKEPLKYEGKESGWIDRFIVKHPWAFWVGKIAALITLIISLILWYGSN